jgi:hypothetical protein
MSIITSLVVVALMCVVGSLAFGIAAMTQHGEVGHRTSSQWMTMRVTFQAVALVLILMAVWTG